MLPFCGFSVVPLKSQAVPIQPGIIVSATALVKIFSFSILEIFGQPAFCFCLEMRIEFLQES
jgi:hypothetical protein